jgi:hypothetical protein
MKRIHLGVVAALALASLGIGVTPATAGPCHEEECPPCATASVDAIVRKATGQDLFMCPA